MEDNSKLIPPGEVAKRFGVDPKTVARWADTGKLKYVRTMGGHRRFRETDINALLSQLHNN